MEPYKQLGKGQIGEKTHGAIIFTYDRVVSKYGYEKYKYE